jgi:hypothetical protein
MMRTKAPCFIAIMSDGLRGRNTLAGKNMAERKKWLKG